MTIRKPVQYELRHYAEARSSLRRWSTIALIALRWTLIIALVLAYFAFSDWLMEQQRIAAGIPRFRRHGRFEFLTPWIPYFILVPIIIWGRFSARKTQQKAWLEKVQIAGIHDIEYSPNGIAYWSDKASYCFRWDAIVRLVDRPHIFVIFLNRVLALVMPKTDLTPEEASQILRWKADFPHASPPPLAHEPVPAGAVTLHVQLNRTDYRDSLKLQKPSTFKTFGIVMRWVSRAFLLFVAIVIAVSVFASNRTRSDPLRYYRALSLPAFFVLLFTQSYLFNWYQRYSLWRKMAPSVTRLRTLYLTDLGLHFHSDCESHFYQWPAFTSLQVGKYIALLHVAGGGSLGIPLRQMPDQASLLYELRQRISPQTRAFPVLPPEPARTDLFPE